MGDEIVYFHSSGIQASVVSHFGRCLMRVSVDQAIFPAANAVKVEVFYQSCDDSGLPVGGPVVLDHAVLMLEQYTKDSAAWADHWLPQGLSLETARNCHYRVIPDTIVDVDKAEQAPEDFFE